MKTNHKTDAVRSLKMACILALGLCATGWGAQIVKWDFSTLPGGTSNYGPSPMTATANDANATIGGLTRGSGVGTTGSGAAKAWGGNNFTATSQANAILSNTFATFTLTANSGYTMSLSDIAIYNIRHSGTGPTTGIWQYKVDSGSFTDIGSAITWGTTTTSTGNDQAAITLTGITALQSLPAGSVVTFRIIAWGASGSGGTWYLNDQTNAPRHLIVNGSISSAGPIVEPSLQSTSVGFGNVGARQMDVSWTNGDGSSQLVICRQGSAPDGAPVDGTDYTADANFAGVGSALGSGKVVYKGSGNAFTLTGLTAGTNYYLQVFEFNGSGATANYLTTTATGNPGSQATPAVSGDGSFTIFHVNDTHARLTPHWFVIPQHGTTNADFELVGGAACLATEVLQTRASHTNSLFLDAGDISEGNPIGDMNGNGSMVQFYNLLDSKLKAASGRGIDASVVGNHDVRDMSYINNLRSASYPVISMNICSNGTRVPFFKPYVMVTINGTKIGILGYTTGNAEVGASVDPVIDVVPCDWTSSVATNIHIADYVKELRVTNHCDVVILLAHIGHSAICTDTAVTKALLVDNGTVRVPEIVVSGHWHTWSSTVWQPEELNYKTIFTESASYMKYLGELTVDQSGNYLSATQHVLRNADIPADPDVAAYIAALKYQYNTNAIALGRPQADQIIGYTAIPLFLDNMMKWWSPDEYPWTGDNTAGEWICDAMRWKAEQVFSTNCDLALEAGGGVRADVRAGPVTMTQIYETFPWNDDLLTLVRMTGQEIWNFVKANNCDAAMSQGWLVTAHDGVPTAITYNGTPINLSQSYNVAINNYMYDHPTTGFTYSDPSPQVSSSLCRDGLIDYTAQFTATNPMTVLGPRYHLDTEFSGGYRAVVMMMNDADSSPSYDDAFVRLLSATPETLTRRGSQQVPAWLLHANGAVNLSHRLSEIELYRSFLGFRTNLLHQGDILEVWGKSSCYKGEPEFVDQEGIYSNGVEFNIVGHDDSLAQPEFVPSITVVMDDNHKNHYVKFFATRTGASAVTDKNNASLSVMDATGYAAKTLPGSNGDLLQLTGVPTCENYAMRFRCDSAVSATSLGVTNYPPSSALQPVSPEVRTNLSLTLTATVTLAGADAAGASLMPLADAQVVSGKPTLNYGTNTSMYVQSANSGSYGNERIWLKFSLTNVSSAVTGARLKMYCWKAAGESMPVVALGSTDDTWTETGLNWNNQPDVSVALPQSTNTLSTGITGVWYTWDVTSFVSNQWSGDKLASLSLKAITENAAGTNSYGFEAREYSSSQPILELDTAGGPVVTQTVAQVQFFYRFSTNGLSWGAWTLFQSLSNAPWSVSFSYPDGVGYYEFYSVASDSQHNTEPAPFRADAAVHLVAAGSFDDWQFQYLGGPDPIPADPNADADNDGVPNWAEYVAGTDPTNGNSVLKITDLGPAGSPGSALVQWPGIPGRIYNIQYGTNLLDTVPFPFETGDIFATNACTVPMPPTGQYFFRLKVRLAP